MTIEAVIFDRDGVLSSFDEQKAARFFSSLVPLSIAEMAAQWNELGAREGWPQTLAEEATFFKLFWRQIGAYCQLSEATIHTLIKWDYKETLRAFEDAPPVLSRLKEHGLKIGVLSNFSLASLEPSLEYLELMRYVDVACAATVIGVSKPQAEAYAIVAERLNVPLASCIFVDDEQIHIDGAYRAGIQAAYLVDRGNHAASNNPFVIPDLFELLHVIV